MMLLIWIGCCCGALSSALLYETENDDLRSQVADLERQNQAEDEQRRSLMLQLTGCQQQIGGSQWVPPD
jgi:hypothetical protein